MDKRHLLAFSKILRSHISLNAKIHTLNDIEIFLKKYHWEANTIFYNLFFEYKSKFTKHIWVSRASMQHMGKKSGFHRHIWLKSVTHIHGITLINFEFVQDTCNFSHSCSIWLLFIPSLHFYAYGLHFQNECVSGHQLV